MSRAKPAKRKRTVSILRRISLLAPEWMSAAALPWIGFGLGAVLAALLLGLLAGGLGVGLTRISRFGLTGPRPVIIFEPVGVTDRSVSDAGTPLVSALRSSSTPVAVMVENHVDARPAAGLERATVVYEAPAEGGITRYLAVFNLVDVPDVVGPVRSVRPYFIDWAEEWNAVLLHSGGSPNALSRLKAGGITHLDEISADGRYFWRDRKQARPHNLFTSGERIRAAFDFYHLPISVIFSPWLTVAETFERVGTTTHPAVRIATLDQDYCVGYRYDADRNAYERWLGGAVHQTADGATMYAKTVIAQHVKASVLDREGRLFINTNIGGTAIVFLNGEVVAGRWQRQSGRTVFTDSDGKPIRFPDGPIWITMVTPGMEVFIPPAEASVLEPAASLTCP